MMRSLEQDRLNQITGNAWVIKAHIAKEARSMYNFHEYVTYIYTGNRAGMLKVVKGFREDSVGGKLPSVRKVA